MPAENLISKAVFQDAAKPKYLLIADELVQHIVNGQLPTGERLPPQRLSVSAGTVSRAYAILEQRGLATARMGDGTYVRSPEQAPPDLATPVDLAHNVAIPTDDGLALAQSLQRVAADPQLLRQVLSRGEQWHADPFGRAAGRTHWADGPLNKRATAR